jgi:hypothetical protein
MRTAIFRAIFFTNSSGHPARYTCAHTYSDLFLQQKNKHDVILEGFFIGTNKNVAKQQILLREVRQTNYSFSATDEK